MIAIKRDGLFQTTARLQREAKAKLPPDLCAMYGRTRLGEASKLTGPGMVVNEKNRPERIPNSDPSVHRGKSVIEKPLNVVSADAVEDEPEEIEPGIDDERELTTIESVVVPAAGEEVPNLDDIEPERDIDSMEIETESGIA
jgi:hypothetical protein